jgi:hypothetical protein
MLCEPIHKGEDSSNKVNEFYKKQLIAPWAQSLGKKEPNEARPSRASQDIFLTLPITREIGICQYRSTEAEVTLCCSDVRAGKAIMKS